MAHAFDFEFENWREGAACFDQTGFDFFPAPEDTIGIERVKAICRICPVADDCAAFAIETNQTEGVWGGMTQAERVKLRRRWLQDLREAS